MNPTCELPGCGLEMRRHYGASFPDFYVCPRNADAHTLCAKLAESEAKVKELEAKLAEADDGLIRAVESGEPEWAVKKAYDAARDREEARKKGAEHGE